MGKEKSSSGGRGFRAPKRRVRVQEATAKGDKVVCTFTLARTTGGDKKNLTIQTDKVTQTFDCSSQEHAELLALHAVKLHSRRNKNGLIYSLKKLASDESLLTKARRRAGKKYDIRQEIKAEKARLRRLEEERRLRVEKQMAAA